MPLNLPSALALASHKKTIKQILREEREEKKEKFKISSWQWQCDTVSHAVKPFVHGLLPARVHSKESCMYQVRGLWFLHKLGEDSHWVKEWDIEGLGIFCWWEG